MAIGLPESTLLATICAGILFGLYTAIFGYTLHVLLHKGRQREARVPTKIVAVSVAMYVVSLISLVASIVRTVTGLIGNSGVDHIARRQAPLALLIDVALIVQTLLGDGFLIYRLKLVWFNDPWVPAIMVLIWFGNVVAGAGVIHAEATIVPVSGNVRGGFISWCIPAFLGTTLATNAISTALITLRLLYVHRRAGKYAQSARGVNLVHAAQILLESGGVYLLTLAAVLGTQLAQSMAQYIILGLLPHIIGVTFSIIIIRVHLKASSSRGWATRSTRTDHLATPSLPSLPRHTQSLGRHKPDEQPDGDAEMEMEGLAIRVDKTSTVHIDFGPSSRDHQGI